MKTTNATPETLPCPTCSVKLNHRATVWFLREKSAWELADMTGGATEEHMKECAAFLDRVQRYGLADARHWEADQNPRNFGENGEPKPRHAAEEKRLEKRFAKLSGELAALSGGTLRMVTYDLYPSIVDESGRDLYLLHWF